MRTVFDTNVFGVVRVIHAFPRKGLPGHAHQRRGTGFTKTDINGNTGTQSVEEGAEIIVRMAQVGPDGPTGGYFSAQGARAALVRP
ncbi:hypothetical protein GCM10023083_20730 [Streptomyces phyllanthi]